MSELHEQVDSILQSDVPDRHTFFQLNFFILGKEPTHQAKLKRCVVELKTRKRSVDAMSMEIDDIKDRNHLLYWEISNTSFLNTEEREIKCRMADRKIVANNMAIDDLVSKVKFIEEEMIFFVEAFKRLSEVEILKQWDSLEVQTEYWNAKLLEDVNHRILMQMPLDVEILKTVLAMPNSVVRDRVIGLLHKQINKGEAISVVA